MFGPTSLDTFERELGASPAEFVRSLRQAAPGAVHAHGDGRFSVECGSVSLRMRIQEMPPRRIGLFVLPVLKVRYRFDSGEPQARKTLLERLDRAMQRGGG